MHLRFGGIKAESYVTNLTCTLLMSFHMMMVFMRMTFKSQRLGLPKPFVKIDTKHKKILEGFVCFS